MTTYVSRHEMDHSIDQEEIEYHIKRREKQIRSLEMDASDADLWLFPFCRAAEEALLFDPRAAKLETWEAWTIAMQYCNAVFAVSEAERGSEVEYLINQQVRTLEAPGLLFCADASNWETAFFLAVTCRDNARAEALCRIPVERLRRAAEGAKVTYNEFTYHWIAALQAYVTGGPGLVDELRQAMELSDPRRGAFGGDTLDLTVFPKMEVFRRLLMGDSDKFNEALVQALESFKSYCSPERLGTSVDGIVPLGLLAFACLAYDRSGLVSDFTLDVESEYLPKHIVERSWYGEFPV